jgi:hypothetical protein
LAATVYVTVPSDFPSPKVTAIQFSSVVAFQAHSPATWVWKLPPSRVTTCEAGAIVRSHEAADEEVGVLTLPLQADASDSAQASKNRRVFPVMYRETSRGAGSNSDVGQKPMISEGSGTTALQP